MESKSRAELVRIGKLLLKMITIENVDPYFAVSFRNGKLKKALFQFEGVSATHTHEIISTL